MNIMSQVTLKGLKNNITRTIVTIIGVILSAAMITAVTTFASSIQNYLLNYSIARTGDWHLRIDIDEASSYQDIIEDDMLKDISVVRSGGYSILEGGVNEYKPYLHIIEIDKKASEILPINLIEGRLPENSDEVVISEHIHSNGGVEYKLGEKLDLEVGQRYVDGHLLKQHYSFNHEDDGQSEEFIAEGSRNFTIVGISHRLPHEIEGFSYPGYSIITNLGDSFLDSGEDQQLSLYLNFKKPSKTYELEFDYQNKYNIENSVFNYDVLRSQGISDLDGFNGVLYGLASIVMALIMVGSISLIYNSFSISVSERKKQFGLLSSVGATRKQLINSVLFEALFIAAIGIPIGIASGILGIGITLYKLKDNFIKVLNLDIPIELTLSVSIPSIIIAIILSLVTILISAYIPAKRAKKLSAIDAVRQNSDIKLTAKGVKTSHLTRIIFGIEGDFALKNLKRNKKRYRSTVISLFISVLLFISASSFSMYLTDSVEDVYEDYNFDIVYTVYNNESVSPEHKKAYEDIANLDRIQNSSIVSTGYVHSTINKDLIETSYYTKMLDQGLVMEEDGMLINIHVNRLDHESFVEYIKELNLKLEDFQDPNEIKAVVIDKQHYFDPDQGRYVNTNIFKDESNTTINIRRYDDEDKVNEVPITFGAFAQTTPIGIEDYSYGNEFQLILDDSVISRSESHMKDLEWNTGYNMYFKSDDPSAVTSDIEKILEDADLNSDNIYNVAERVEDNRNIITILNVFAYGFIILMSLITIANVFNTITTNINLRRREFAMLKSVGMTNRSFHKMLNFECIFYGLKALLYGIPASTFVTYLIYLSIQQGLDTDFYLPIRSIIISVFSVFLVVFISMMYSMRKIKNENILDALKKESL